MTEGKAYEALKDFESDFWLKALIPYDDLCSERKGITKSVTEYLKPLYEMDEFKIVNAKTEEDKSLGLNFFNLDKFLDFSEANLGEVIFNFYRILSCKVDYRDNGCEAKNKNEIKNKYVTKSVGLINGIYFDKKGYGYTTGKCNENEMIDPYFTEINIGPRIYCLYLNYSGNKSSKQPGNCCLKQKDETPQRWINRGKYNLKLSNNEHYILQNLLLCLEVARRRVVDIKRINEIEKDDGICGFKDVYCSLPILGAIVIGLELINDQKIEKKDFFAGQYRCFSNRKKYKKQREENIKKLLLTYLKNKGIQTEEQFKKEVQILYKNFIKQKVTDRVFSRTCLVDFLSNENILNKLKERGFDSDTRVKS